MEMSPLWPVNHAATNQFFGMIGNSLAALPVIPCCLWRWRGRAAPLRQPLLLSLSYLTALLGALLHQRLAVPLSAYGADPRLRLVRDAVRSRARTARPLTRRSRASSPAIIVVFGGQLWLLLPSAAENAEWHRVPKAAGFANRSR